MPVSIDNRSGVVNDPVLTNLARQYRPQGFIADFIAPRVSVAKESGKYLIFTDRDFGATDVDLLKPDRSKTKEVDFGYSTASFSLEEYAVKASISRRERENVDSQLRLEQNKLNLIQDQLALAREVRVAALLNTQDATPAGGLDNSMDATPSTNWDQDAATIEADIKTGIEAIYDAIGVLPTHLVIPYKVANAIAIQQDIRDILKYTVNGQQILSQGGGILPSQLWGLTVLTPTVRKYTNVEGATDAVSDVWGDEVRILYVNPSGGYGSPTVAQTFQTRGPEVRRWAENDPQVDYIATSEVLSEDIIAPKAGYIIKDVLS
jgi:hypothetical protein